MTKKRPRLGIITKLKAFGFIASFFVYLRTFKMALWQTAVQLGKILQFSEILEEKEKSPPGCNNSLNRLNVMEIVPASSPPRSERRMREFFTMIFLREMHNILLGRKNHRVALLGFTR